MGADKTAELVIELAAQGIGDGLSQILTTDHIKSGTWWKTKLFR